MGEGRSSPESRDGVVGVGKRGDGPLRDRMVSPVFKRWKLALVLEKHVLTRRERSPRKTKASTVKRLELPKMDPPRVERIRLP